ncbi:MAG: hypothetical protein ACREHV_14915 [Rhizomicrobium sp.]
MHRIIIIIVLVASCFAFTAQAKDFKCKGPGKCICSESIAPAAVLGYNATADGESVNVDIVCINQTTMDVSYYQVRKEDGLGGSYTSAPVPHD